jgi:glycosyltransferase involved in cell wall biosynthesis
MSSEPRPGSSFPTTLHIDTARTWGGGQNQVRYMVMGLRALGRRAILVAHPQGELLRRMAEGPDLIPLSPTHEVDLTAAWSLSRVIKTLRPDVVHAHDPHAVAMAASGIAIIDPQPRLPLVASRRIDFHVPHTSFSRWKYSRVERFIASCRAIEAHLIGDGIPSHRISVVHEGVDVERIARLPAGSVHAELFLPTHAPIVGNVGALVRHKGQHDLIEVAALVVREVPDVRFVILGEGELRQALEDQIRRHHLERHVFLAGFRANVLELTKAFDVFVVSSHHEGLCTTLIDAMAASRPSVGTAVGGVPEVVVDGETGFLVPPGDHTAMARRIVQLLKDPALRARMGAAGLARARAEFTVNQMVAGTEAVYEDLLRPDHGAADRRSRVQS